MTRAGKGWCYEGGIRVPLIMSTFYPEKVYELKRKLIYLQKNTGSKLPVENPDYTLN